MTDDKEILTSESKGDYSTFQHTGEHDLDKNEMGQSFTVQEAVDKMGFGWFQVKAGVAAGFAWVADGMEIMVLSVLGPTLLCEWKLELWQEAFLTTVVFLGFFFGSPVFGFCGDKIGRRKSLLISSLWTFIFGAVSALSPNFTALLILRFLTGFGVGGAPQAITYFSEFLPNKTRGRSIILVEFFWAIGGMLEVVLAILILIPFNWRWWLFASATPCLIFVFACFFLPESPRYVLASGDTKGALEILQRASKDNKVELPPGELIAEPDVPRGNVKDLVQPKYRLTSGLLSILWFSAAFSYYGVILFTTDMIKMGTTCDPYGYQTNNKICFNTTSDTQTSATVTQSFNGTTSGGGIQCIPCKPLTLVDYYDLLWTSAAELPGLAITAVLVDLIGRKKTLNIEFLIFAVVCFCLFICMDRTPMIVTLFVGRAIISSAFQVLYVYTPEVYPTSVRALSVGLGSMFGRVGATITPYIAEVLLDASLYYGLSVYGVIGFLAAVISMLLPIETKGQNLT